MTTTLRNHPRFLLASYLADAPKLLLLLATAVVTRVTEGSMLSSVLAWASVVWLVVLVIEPPVKYFTNRYRIDESGVHHRGAFIVVSQRSIPWSAVTSVEVERPWAYRLLGISRIRITQTGDESTHIQLHAVSDDVVQLAQTLAAGQPLHVLHESAHDDAGPAPLHVAGVKELALMSLTQGQMIVLGATLLIGVVELIDEFGLIGAVGEALTRLPLPLVIGVGVGATLAAGIVATVVRFHSFEVRQHGTQLVTRYGLFERRERRFDADDVLGVVVHQNVVELLLRRARLGVLTRDATARMTTNTVLPSAPLPLVEHVVNTHFPALSGASRTPRFPVARIVGFVAATLLPAAGIAAAGHFWGAPLWASILLFVVAWRALHFVARAAATSLHFDGAQGTLSITMCGSHLEEVRVFATRIHRISQHGWRTKPNTVWWASLTIFAGGPRRFIALHPDVTHTARIAQSIRLSPIPQRSYV